MVRVNQLGVPDPTGSIIAPDIPDDMNFPAWTGRAWRTDSSRYMQIPPAVTQRQARLALLQQGLLKHVETALASISDTNAREAAKIEWEYGSEIRRDSHLIAQLAPALGLSASQIDSLFVAAGAL